MLFSQVSREESIHSGQRFDYAHRDKTKANALSVTRLDVEQEVHHVAVLHDVVLPFRAQLARRATR